jgi:hypothetical protein
MDVNNTEKILEELEKLTPDEISKILDFKGNYDHLENQLDKLIDCPHEIVFTITANVLTQNEKGELTGTREVCTQNYHIPVPVDKDYNEYMKAFFSYLEEHIIKTVNHADQTSKGNNNE